MSNEQKCRACGIETSHELLGRRVESQQITRAIQVMKCEQCGFETPEEINSLRFELLGGFYHGTVIEGADARGVNLLTDGGTIGKRFWWGGTIIGRKYVVVERAYEHGELRVRSQYGGIR